MICKYCGEDMVTICKWLNYPEPSEWIYGCMHCYATVNIHQAYGEQWTRGIYDYEECDMD